MRVKIKKYISGILIILILFIMIGCNDTPNNELPPEETPIELDNYNVLKDETVYVNLNSSGKVSKIDVVNHLINVTEGIYIDYGYFNNAFSISDINNILVNDNHLELKLLNSYDNFYYQTELNYQTEIPFLVNIKYYHNNILKEPEQMKGKTGNVKIEIEVKSNPNIGLAFKNSLAFQLQVPISVTCNTILNHNATSQVLVGKTMTLAFMVLPNTDKTFTIELDSKGFEIGDMQASIQTFDIENMLGFNLNDIFDNINLLIDGLTELNNGSLLLGSGLHLVDNNLQIINNAIGQLSDGLNEFGDGLDSIYDALLQLKGGLNPITDGLNTLSNEGDGLISGFAELKDAFLQIIDGLSYLTLLPTMPSKEELNQLSAGIIAFDEGLNLYHNGVKEIANGMTILNEGFNQLVSMFPDVTDGFDQISNGALEFKDGFGELANEFSDLPEGMDELSDGLSLILEGINEMLSFLDDFPSISDDYILPSFTSINNEFPRSVQFIYNIKGISLRS